MAARDITCDLCSDWALDATGTLTVELRDDVRWQRTEHQLDRALTAEDVKFSLDRLGDPKFPNSQLVRTIGGTHVNGTHEVLIDLSIHDAEIFDKLADARASIVQPEALELQDGLLEGPTIGTGPWILESFSANRMRFRANADYHFEGLPRMDGIDIEVIEDPQTRVISLRTGRLDLAQPSVGGVMDAAATFEELRWSATHDASTGIEVAFNLNREPLGSTDVRNAIFNAWDPASHIGPENQYQSFMTVGLPVNDPEWLLNQSEIEQFFDDRVGLLQLLETGIVPRGFVLNIRVGRFGDAYMNTARSLAAAMSSIGLVTTVEAVSTRTFGEDVWTYGDFDVYVGASPPQSSVTSTLFAVHHSNGPWNSTGYSDPELDDLIERQVGEFNPVRRKALVMEIQRAILRGRYLVNVAAQVSHWLWWSHLRDVAPNPYRADSFWLSRLWLSDRVR